ncbi:uncharacterized protein LOC123196983 [Mangifera indica]|uniref:uncharacterized protein LOC123196983 n=1 Tax=Mangifera indica TaxID=29780 RepID=UPI001CFBD946|nr:uncharacterized protein LOC123196983 [Mangifera indica]XP_044467085.1 uncharacterized protein LOC123196983 [Mangifera indica]
MRRTLVNNAFLFTQNLFHHPNSNPSFVPLAASIRSPLRLYSCDSNDSSKDQSLPAPVLNPPWQLKPRRRRCLSISRMLVTKMGWSFLSELKMRIQKYFKGDEETLPAILEAKLQRRLTGKHDETDDELVEELQMKPLDDIKDKEFESDFEELYETDEEIDDLYNARDYVMKKMVKDEYFNMDKKKWDEMISEAVQHGYLRDTRECEEILKDILAGTSSCQKTVEEKFIELLGMCERGELEPEQAYELFKELGWNSLRIHEMV